MSDGTFELPDTDDVLGEEQHAAPMTPIPVVHQGPVRAQNPGVRLGALINKNLGDTVEQLVGDDPRRASLVLYATSGTAAFFFGTDRNAVQSGTSFRLNTNIPIRLNTGQALYARSATLGTASQVSVATELYTD